MKKKPHSRPKRKPKLSFENDLNPDVTFFNPYRPGELEDMRNDFIRNNNPVSALEVFLFACEDDRTRIPDWVLDWLATAFQEYLASGGKKPLEQLLGFRRSSHATPFQVAERWFRIRLLVTRVLELRALNVKWDTAVQAVAEKFTEEGDPNPWFQPKMKPIKTKYLKKLCFNYLKFHRREVEPWMKVWAKWPNATKRRFLEQYGKTVEQYLPDR